MPVSPILDLLQSEPAQDRLSRHSSDSQTLVTTGLSGNDFHGRSCNAEFGCEVSNQRLIGGSVSGRSSQAYFDGVSVPSDDFGTLRSGLHMDIDVGDERPTTFRPLTSVTHSSASNQPRNTRIRNQATMGVMSIMPIGGITRRRGCTIQSVRV